MENEAREKQVCVCAGGGGVQAGPPDGCACSETVAALALSPSGKTTLLHDSRRRVPESDATVPAIENTDRPGEA